MLRHIPYVGDDDSDGFLNELFKTYEDALAMRLESGVSEQNGVLNETIMEVVQQCQQRISGERVRRCPTHTHTRAPACSVLFAGKSTMWCAG